MPNTTKDFQAYSTELSGNLLRYGASRLSVLSPMTHQQYLDLMLGQDPGLSRLRAELAAFDQSFFLWRWWRRLVSMFEPISLLQQRALLSFHETQQLQTQLADLKSCTEESRRTSLINEINALKSQWEINQKAISFWSGLWKALNLMKQCFALPETQSLLQKERAIVAVGLDGKLSIPTAKMVEAEASAVVYDYRVLKLNKGASLEAIKEAYRKASRLYHPDKGGSHELFTQLQQEHQRIKAELEERRVGDDKINELEKRIDSMEKTHAAHRAKMEADEAAHRAEMQADEAAHRAKMQADEAAHREEMMARERAAEERESCRRERESCRRERESCRRERESCLGRASNRDEHEA